MCTEQMCKVLLDAGEQSSYRDWRVQKNKLVANKRDLNSMCVNIFNFFAKIAPAYISEMYSSVEQSQHTRTSLKQLKLPNQTTNRGLKTLSYIGPRLWNALPISILSVNSVNSFKHKLKENFFKEIQKSEDSLWR